MADTTAADRAPEPHGRAQRLEERRPHVGGLDRQRRRHRLPGVPRSRGDREPSAPPPRPTRTPTSRPALQLQGAGPGRRRQPVRLQQRGERDGAGHDQAHGAGEPRGDRRTAPRRWTSRGTSRPTTSPSRHYRVYRDDAACRDRRPGTTSYSDTVAARHVLRTWCGPWTRPTTCPTRATPPRSRSRPPTSRRPPHPENLTADAVGGGQADLAWDASSDNVAVTGYRIYRNGQAVATIEPGTSYSDTVPPGDYTYVGARARRRRPRVGTRAMPRT